MKLCVSFNMIDRNLEKTFCDPMHVISAAKEAGFEEFDMQFSTRVLMMEGAEKILPTCVETIEKNGMHVRFTHLPFDYPKASDDEGWARFTQATHRAIDFSAEIGADCAAVHCGRMMTERYDAEAEYAAALEFLKPFADHAARVGLTLGQEIMRGPGWSGKQSVRRLCMNTDELIMLADDLGTGICWDTGHGHISLQDQYRSLIKIGSRLKEVHLDDNFGENDIHLAPYLGNLPWDQVIRGLREVGYRNSLNEEVACGRLPPELQKNYARIMADGLKKIRDGILENTAE